MRQSLTIKKEGVYGGVFFLKVLRFFRFQGKVVLAFGKHFGKFTVNVVKAVSVYGISNKARKLTYFLKGILTY